MLNDIQSISDKPGLQLDAMLSEEVMGISLKPHRDVALVAIGWRYIAETGHEFHLRTGDKIPVPNGKELRKPEGEEDWNARYACHVAEFLTDKYPNISQEVEDYRTKPYPFSTTWEGMRLVVEEMRIRGFMFELRESVIGDESKAMFANWSHAFISKQTSSPHAVAAAAIKAIRGGGQTNG